MEHKATEPGVNVQADTPLDPSPSPPSTVGTASEVERLDSIEERITDKQQQDIAKETRDVLDALTEQIKHDIERREHGKEEWVEGTIDLCLHLAAARAKFKDNQSFGSWFDASGIPLNKDERAAAIAMGAEIKLAREILQVTERRSLRLIHSKEFRLRSVAKTSERKKPDKPKRAQTLEEAIHVIERREQAGETITRDAVAEEAGVSHGIADSALAVHGARTEAAPPDDIVLSKTAQARFDAKLRAYTKQLDLAFETAVFNEVRRRNKEIGLRFYQEKLDEVESLLNSPRWSVMPVAHFKTILACLHPDNARPGHEDRFNAAFSLFNKYKLKMVDLSAEKEEKDRRKRIELRGAPLPRTVEEMLARKRTKGARP